MSEILQWVGIITAWVVGLFVVLPMVVFCVVKVGSYAWFLGRKRFLEEQENKVKGKNNGS